MKVSHMQRQWLARVLWGDEGMGEEAGDSEAGEAVMGTV